MSLFPAKLPAFIVDKTVAEEIASAFGCNQVAPISEGKLTNINALPAKAGLKIFAPNPPKKAFATIIAKAEPNIVIQIGVVGGRTKASKIPVIIAEQSFIVTVCFVAI